MGARTNSIDVEQPSRASQNMTEPFDTVAVPVNVPIPCVGRSPKQGKVIVAPVTGVVAGALAAVGPLLDGAPAPDIDEAARLKERVEEHLTAQGFAVTNGRILAPVPDKDSIRALHQDAVGAQRRRARSALARHEPKFLQRLARGDDINTANIDPALVFVENYKSLDASLWRWCALHWSIPVSAGYGRRLRFLVVDRAHDNAVMGLIGLADPVFALRARDAWVGWAAERRRTALTNVMDAFVLGAVPPYADLRAGKLVALLAASTEVKDAFARRYANRTSLISQRNPDAALAAVTTTSALGRSSVYNRLRRPDGTLAMLPIGYTAGFGDFHLSGSIYDELVAFARARGLEHRTQRHERWPGSSSGSPRSRRAVLDLALTELGFNSKLLRVHGIQREMFLSPLMHNTAEFLRGDAVAPEWRDLPARDLSAWWQDRWVKTRASRDDLWRDFFPWQWRLWHEPDNREAR